MARGTVVAGVALAAFLASPLLVGQRYDSLPLSTYPMFAGDRSRVAPVSTVVAVDAGGDVHRLSPELIGGTDEPVLASETVVAAIRDGSAGVLCREVARRFGAGSDGAARLEVVTESYDTIAWFDGERTPHDRTVHATCTPPA